MSVDSSIRGLTLCRLFLIQCTVTKNMLQDEPVRTGKILDWAYLCGSKLPAWEQVSDGFMSTNWFYDSITIDGFCDYALGAYRYDAGWYCQWYATCKDEILAFLRRATRTVVLAETDGIISIEFIVENFGGSPHEQTIGRLSQMRMALPFGKEYHAQGAWLLGHGKAPSVNETNKRLHANNLPYERDIERNEAWLEIMEDADRADSYYVYLERLHQMRKEALEAVSSLALCVRDKVEARKEKKDVYNRAWTLFGQWMADVSTRVAPPHQVSCSI